MIEDAPRPLRILLLLTWYTPHVSGLTIAAKRIAEGLNLRGHSVTVVASRHSADLPETETMHGVDVVRSDTLGGISKGFVMPSYIPSVASAVHHHDLVVLFLPAGPCECLAAWLAARRKPLIVEYICDIRLPGGWLDRMIERISKTVFRWTVSAAAKVLFSSQDYAATSPFRHACQDKLEIASLPVEVATPIPAEVARLRAMAVAPHGPILGMAGRLANGKGFELLLEAFPSMRNAFPDATVLCAGQHEHVVGEERYRRAILPRVNAFGKSWQMLGVLHPDLASFFAACDVLVFPSTNRTESFGLVQAEAMLCGTPVVASDLPGVRLPVQSTGMGLLFRSGDAADLADKVIHVLQHRSRYLQPRQLVQRAFSTEAAITERLRVYESVLEKSLTPRACV